MPKFARAEKEAKMTAQLFTLPVPAFCAATEDAIVNQVLTVTADGELALGETFADFDMQAQQEAA